MSEIRQPVSNFVIDHDRDTTSPSLQWEMLKCVLHGLFIKYGKKGKGLVSPKDHLIPKYMYKQGNRLREFE